MPYEAISILVIEDDYSFALELKILVEELGYQVAACIDNGAAAIAYISNTPPDLILMDIDLKGKKNGIEVAENIKHLNIPILFITSYKDDKHYALAKATNLIGFVVKPVEDFTLRTSINLAVENLVQYAEKYSKVEKIFPFKDKLFFKHNNVFKKVVIVTIDYIEGAGNYRIIHLNGEKIVTSLPLNDWEIILADYGFFRAHRKYIINLNKVNAINTTANTLQLNLIDLPISRNKKTTLKEMLKLMH